MALNRSIITVVEKTVLCERDSVQVHLGLLILLVLICATVTHPLALSECAVTLLHEDVSGHAHVSQQGQKHNSADESAGGHIKQRIGLLCLTKKAHIQESENQTIHHIGQTQTQHAFLLTSPAVMTKTGS